jgi:hypothetical protein
MDTNDNNRVAKRGRKPKMNKQQQAVVSVYMSPEERAELTAEAKAQERTLSAFLRLLALKSVRASKPKPEKSSKSSKAGME